METRLAVIETRLPSGAVFLVRDLRALLRAGVVLDLYLFEPDVLDPTLRAEVEAAGGALARIPLPSSAEGLRACLGEFARHPLRFLGSIGLALGLLVRAPEEGWRTLAVLPGALAIGPRIARSGARQAHGLWAGVPATVCYWVRRHYGIRYSFSAHAWDLTVHTAWLPRKARGASGIVVCSEWGRRRLDNLCGEEACERVRLVRHGLDLAEWAFSARPRRAEVPLLLGVGRLTRVKGFDDLVRACSLLRDRGADFRCEILGSDDRGWGEDLRGLIADLGLEDRVLLAGERTSAEVRARMGEADFLVCPFIENPAARWGSRGVPNVVPEAMALGTPVLATDAGGLGELVRPGETGRVFPQRDPAALADSVMQALADWEGTARMARNARALVEETNDLRRTAAAFLEATGLTEATGLAAAPGGTL